MGSSCSSGSPESSTSELLLSESEPNMLMLPTLLDIAIFSPVFDQAFPLWKTFTSDMKELVLLLRCGIAIAFCVIVGEESGDDCSASVE